MLWDAIFLLTNRHVLQTNLQFHWDQSSEEQRLNKVAPIGEIKLSYTIQKMTHIKKSWQIMLIRIAVAPIHIWLRKLKAPTSRCLSMKLGLQLTRFPLTSITQYWQHRRKDTESKVANHSNYDLFFFNSSYGKIICCVQHCCLWHA